MPQILYFSKALQKILMCSGIWELLDQVIFEVLSSSIILFGLKYARVLMRRKLY